MQLHYTRTSPYARLVRALIREKGLSQRVTEIEARTRVAGSPYYSVNASGRVPYLVRDDGVGIEDSQLICLYLDGLDGRRTLHVPFEHQDWAYGRLETYARGMTDGIAVWAREMRRPEGERSPTILAHEAERARRLADHWEGEVGHPLMQGEPNVAQLLLAIGIEFAEHYRMLEIRSGRLRLAAFLARVGARPSMQATRPG